MKRLYRSQQDRVIGGVCGGLGAYFGIDPLIFRLLFIFLTLATGTGIAVYLLLWIILPTAQQAFEEQEEIVQQNIEEIRRQARDMGTQVRRTFRGHTATTRDDALVLIGAILVGIGLMLLLRNLGLLVWMRFLWPIALIALGVAILWNNRKGGG